jgi:hypothetical protein
MLTMIKDPNVFSAQTSGLADLRPLLGTVWIHEDDIENNIIVYREKLMEHLAFIGGLNAFWIAFMWCLCKGFVNSQFDASIRNECAKETVE